MTDYNNDKDLAEILIEGVKVKYGSEKADQIKTEFGKLEKPQYRRNAEDLTAVVNRFCIEPAKAEVLEAEAVKSIDDVIESYSGKPSMLKVAAKGTANLARKAHLHQWYYPLVGFLPAKYQGKIAEKWGDKPFHYTVSNIFFQPAVIMGATYYVMLEKTDSHFVAAVSSVVCGFVDFVGGLFARTAFAKKLYGSEEVAGSLLFELPYAIAKVAAKAPGKIGEGISYVARGIEQCYVDALQEEQQKLLEAKHQQEYQNAGVRVVSNQARIEQPEIVLTQDGERFEYDEENSPSSKKHHSRYDGGH